MLDDDKISHGEGSKLSHSASGTGSLASSRLSVQSAKTPENDEMLPNFFDKAKFYTSLCLGTTAIISVFAFLFLIPFVVDPAISTIVADYDPVPVTCIVIDHIYAEGLKNCTWASCREGCTNAAIRCHQLVVNYSKIPWEEFKNTPLKIHTIEWDGWDKQFLINSEGCGYPPSVNCSIFARDYGYSHIGEPFPCFYSRAYPDRVIGRYSWEDNLKHLILSIIIPNLIFAISIGVLSYWYCPCCDKACHKSARVYAEKYPAKEE